MAKRLDKTLADYLVIAVGPVLIMALVGSLVFFLLEVTYAGEHAERLRWILFWFVIAAVLIARIGIEQGKEHAAAYGLALGVAVSLVILRYVEQFALGGLCLLAVIWWCANKLTWDCTLIDDSEDASGEGLLQVSGLEPPAGSAGVSPAPRAAETAALPAKGIATDNRPETPPVTRPVPFWRQVLLNADEREGRPHAPGLWVVYFSLAALPLFGIGQALIPSAATERRAYAFGLLAVYVTAGLGLLLTTSFLGLRRYLRQRKLQMPAAMTAIWMVMGAGLIALLLGLCLLLPRPEAEYSVTALMDKAAERLHQASRFGMKADDAGQGEGRRVGRSDEPRDQAANRPQGERNGQTNPNAKPSDAQRGNPPQGEGQGERKAQGRGGQQDQQKADQQATARNDRSDENRRNPPPRNEQRPPQEARKPDQQAQQQPNNDTADQPSPPSSPPPGRSPSEALAWLLRMGKFLVYIALAVAALYVVVRYWEQILEALRRIWNDLWSLFGGQSPERTADAAETAAVPPPKPFADFANPFSTGAARRMPPDELVRYTFAALEAWAFEHDAPRQRMQTPLEFGQHLGDEFPDLADDLRPLIRHYAALAYAHQSPPNSCRADLERLWRALTTQPAAV